MTQSVFEKHPRRTLTIVVLCALVVLAAIFEITLRFTVSYDIGYYTAIKKPGEYVYPYGTISINKDEFPDSEFDLSSKKPRVGYFGDSIIMGIGAGDGYRISDILEKTYPNLDHWTFATMGNGINEKMLLRMIEEYKIDYVVYGFNLNDFLPPTDDNNQPVATEEQTFTERSLQKTQLFARKYLDGLRGKSYLYTVLRTSVKNILQHYGFGHTGFIEAELYPNKNVEIIQKTATRLNAVQKTLQDKGVGFCFIIFPYEMQVSKDAANTYRDLGVTWEEGFAEGSTQKMFLEYLNFPHIYDGRAAFPQEKPVGTYFVYNKGDKIDFNHPNRAGHALLTKDFIKSGACPFLR